MCPSGRTELQAPLPISFVSFVLYIFVFVNNTMIYKNTLLQSYYKRSPLEYTCVKQIALRLDGTIHYVDFPSKNTHHLEFTHSFAAREIVDFCLTSSNIFPLFGAYPWNVIVCDMHPTKRVVLHICNISIFMSKLNKRRRRLGLPEFRF